MKTLRVNTARAYDILVGRGLLEQAGALSREVNGGSRALIVTDSHVFPLYAGAAARSFEEAGYQTAVFTFPAGEENKRLEIIAEIYGRLAVGGFTRKDLLVALGGGVTGDMTGFAAATWLRGMDFVQIPTTLLAQVDSSVGGKTGVDIPQGKNLVGAFWQPVERDENETGERKLLNFGHTMGHALEKYYDYSALSHGRAVALGMVLITEASQRQGLTEKGTVERICAVLERHGLPIADTATLDDYLPGVALDKKRSGTDIDLALLRRIGEGFLYRMPVALLGGFLRGEEL